MEIKIIQSYLLQLLLLKELEQMYRRRRYLLFFRLRQNDAQTTPLYCNINLSLPVLDRFFKNEDPKPDFRLSRNSPAVLLNLLDQDRRHGWGAVIETLVFIFWLASGASYRVVSGVFGISRSTVHCIVHRLTEEVLAIHHKVIHLPKPPEDLEVVSRGFAGLARHRAFLKAAGSIDGCHIRLCVTIGAASLTPMWAGLGRCMTPGCSATVHYTGRRGLPSSRALHPSRWWIPVSPTPTPPHHSPQACERRCCSPVLQQSSFQKRPRL
ncbi:uncharacterized protein LOC112136470 isoform X2 [Oryzias melastigma]|uniref:uncharacterized protein LOC112136470 isoform X2 n=1 Tax=Oryzias melastigma TaxID=30732 RepID=UPI00168D5D54|nr:uncharacterized protein LOC112136470 isoform X2 [Oryzias melastigma]